MFNETANLLRKHLGLRVGHVPVVDGQSELVDGPFAEERNIFIRQGQVGAVLITACLLVYHNRRGLSLPAGAVREYNHHALLTEVVSLAHGAKAQHE